MGIAWGLATYSPSFVQRDAEYRARGMAPIQARVAIARHACRLTFRLLKTQQPSTRSVIVEEGSTRTVTATLAMPHTFTFGSRCDGAT
jgi:hypothetical protein